MPRRSNPDRRKSPPGPTGIASQCKAIDGSIPDGFSLQLVDELPDGHSPSKNLLEVGTEWLDDLQLMPTNQEGPFQAGHVPIPGFELVRKIGNGGFGTVWEAKGPGGIHVAIKSLWIGSAKSGTEWQGLKHCRTVRHPHLLSLLGIWLVDGWLLVVSELADSDLGTEFELAKNNGQVGLDSATLAPWFRDAAEGLDHLHGREPGLCHGDIKPGNLLLLGGRCKVGDFGSLHPMYDKRLLCIRGMTHYFAAPETENGLSHANSDQFSLAMTYSLLRGIPPFTEEEKNDPKKIEEKLGDSKLSKSEWRSLCKGLQRNPDERHGSCSAMVHSFSL